MLQIEQEGRVLKLLLDRPEKKNALDHALTRALVAGISDAIDDPQVHVIVIASTSDDFSAGRDLAETAGMTGRREILALDEDWAQVFKLLHRSPKPSLASVGGRALAGGFTLAMGCDFVLAERGASFGAVEMRNGFPAAVCTPILARLLGPRLGLELALFGDIVGAERLWQIGLVNDLADGEADLKAKTEKYAHRLAALDPQALALTRETFRAAEQMPLENALDMGKHLNQFLSASGWFREGFEALKKRRQG